ncbi:hydroxymethylpyrimidine/phosphomethylpyrimidine kinase [Pontibacter sp. E15-1]|uniref:hydroxymethylpyrimidine/phosphomethylpyrimidine kinase n=1 Tax=Pontibacter sp. E15-1 TaxID=2919918 RepID=UPI001F4F1728|nr:hydroxymethylpyrimidine/phosphomethylpyrimidine kinase [Pontibacter sp. E15-1]MCJ8165135.1 hydroxymethylpyrimidine/phosphomethylpyrimidine kinase [Pontibacter sp. E15-1]
MPKQRPYTLSIAGFDPSGGAGLTADSKTFEALKVQGLSACTAITYQHEAMFAGVDWLGIGQLEKQLTALLGRYKVPFAKIGLVQSMDALLQVLELVQRLSPETKLVWDPILKASASFPFHEEVHAAQLEELCQRLYLITPNWNEMQQLMPHLPPMEAAAALSLHCHVLLKGGHNEAKPGYDYLFSNGTMRSFRPKQPVPQGKHGSGCVLSAAVTALLAQGYPLPKACRKAKDYTTRFLNSNSTLLGYHYL